MNFQGRMSNDALRTLDNSMSSLEIDATPQEDIEDGNKEENGNGSMINQVTINFKWGRAFRNMYIYYMAELVFRSIRQITHAEWLLRGRYFIILPSRWIRFFLGPLSFSGKISCLLKNTINESQIGVNKKWHKKANRIK